MLFDKFGGKYHSAHEQLEPPGTVKNQSAPPCTLGETFSVSAFVQLGFVIAKLCASLGAHDDGHYR
jgi:hypothetical protein